MRPFNPKMHLKSGRHRPDLIKLWPLLCGFAETRITIATMETPIHNYHADALRTFRSYKSLAEGALGQISEEEFFAQLDPESNSVALLVKHLAGNMHSRWHDFLTSDGEKPDRDRDTEFEIIGDTRDGLMEYWETGWQTLFSNIEPLASDDFSHTITIRGEPHTVVEAINRQLTHYAYHIGQIVFLAKHFRSSFWKTLSVPKNRSAAFNEFLAERQALGLTRIDRSDVSEEFAQREK